MSKAGVWAGWAAALALAACGAEHDGPVRGDPRLRGTWTADFTLATPLRLAGTQAGARVRGEVVLMENHTVHTLPHLDGVPTDYGTYGADFRPLGLPEPAEGRVPTLAARSYAADSVKMVLEGVGTGGPVVLTGRMQSDTVAGRWSYAGDRAGGAQGTFVLRRRKG